ncbi:hypothetical protein QL996_00040 [Planococcus sp. APC 4015]|nr:hypothetical protein [Planococcus sp. APC 4015]
MDLGDAYIPADAVETAALRAGSLRGLLGDTLAATHLTAAWIHGPMLNPPAQHTVQRAVRRRLHAVHNMRLVYRDPVVEIDDLELIGGVWVTTPARTLGDLVRVDDDAHAEAARAFARDVPAACADAIAWLESHPGIPRKLPGLVVLRSYARSITKT